jgi:rfaE bifunctional protein nucleotidyltransferase chain/domain
MDKLQVIKDKIVEAVELERLVNRWKLKDDVVVFTNGCFDLLHKGHFEYLAKAASLGDRVVVALNSDQSVKALKGENRPVNDQDARALALASLHLTDAVVLFDENTPEELIKLVEPDFLVKGGDWKKEDIVGADFVEANGGKVETIELTEGYSTTDIINRLN